MPTVLVAMRLRILLGKSLESAFERHYGATPPAFATFYGLSLVFVVLPNPLVTLVDSEARGWMSFPRKTTT